MIIEYHGRMIWNFDLTCADDLWLSICALLIQGTATYSDVQNVLRAIGPKSIFPESCGGLELTGGTQFQKNPAWAMMQPGEQEFPSKICQNHLGESFSKHLFLELMLGLEPLIIVLFGNGLNSQGVAIFGYTCSLVFARVHQELEKLKIYRFTSPCSTKMKTGTPLSMEIATFFQSCL